MALITNSTSKFPTELVTDIFSKVKGHSTLAKLSAQEPVPFSGTDVFAFTMDGEVAIVGEGQAKPAGEADFTPTTIKPIKVIYQHRLTDEFVKMAEEKQLPYLQSFTEGFAKKLARGIDICAIHGVNPADNKASATIGDKCFAKAVTNSIKYNTAAPDDNIDDAVTVIQSAEGSVTGIALSTTMASAIGKVKASGTGAHLYPEYRFGGNPGTFGGMLADVNTTINFKNSKIRGIVGDFANAFKWGYADELPLEIIQYGDPDGQGDLKAQNQIVLRSEAYIGWGILDAESFAKIEEQAS